MSPQPASKNYHQLRSALLQRGTNLRRWAVRSGYPVGSVYLAAKGLRHGVQAHAIRRALSQFIKTIPHE